MDRDPLFSGPLTESERIVAAVACFVLCLAVGAVILALVGLV